jgi:hypothetical protein
MKEKNENQNEEVLNVSLEKISNNIDVQHLLNSGSIPPGLDTAEKIMTVITTGKELGLQPMTSINNINVIKGKTVISSAMLGALLKRNNIEYIYTKDYFKEDDGKIVTELEFEWLSKITGKIKNCKFSVSWQEMELAGYTVNPSWQKYPKFFGA